MIERWASYRMTPVRAGSQCEYELSMRISSCSKTRLTMSWIADTDPLMALNANP